MSRNVVRIRGYNVDFEVLDHELSVILYDRYGSNMDEKVSELRRVCSNSVEEYNDNVIEQILEITRQYSSPVTVQCRMKLLVPKNKNISIEPGDRISIKMALSRLSAEVLDVSFQENDSVDSRSFELKFKNFRRSPRRDFSLSIKINLKRR